MRTFLSSTVAACAAALLLSPTAASASPAPQLKITHNTGAIYQSDPSPDGDGVLYDTVQVGAELRHCPPAAIYLRSISLVQDGVSYEWATTALGAVEIGCTAAGTAAAGMSFVGNGLHPEPPSSRSPSPAESTEPWWHRTAVRSASLPATTSPEVTARPGPA